MKIFFYIFLLVFGCGLSFANDKNVENNNQKTDIASDDFKYENSVFFTDKKINIIDRVYKIYEKNMKYCFLIVGKCYFKFKFGFRGV